MKISTHPLQGCGIGYVGFKLLMASNLYRKISHSLQGCGIGYVIFMLLMAPRPPQETSLRGSEVQEPDLVCRLSMARRAVSGESLSAPGAFLTGANSSSRFTSSSATRSAHLSVSKMNSSSFMPCRPRTAQSVWQPSCMHARIHRWYLLLGLSHVQCYLVHLQDHSCPKDVAERCMLLLTDMQ